MTNTSSSIQNTARRNDLDLLKGLAIIAVIFYHFGFFTYGYLGVDLFLVISGFLITKGLISKFENDSFSYVDFVVKRFSRLFPLVILAGAVSLLVGAISMLPDNYENLAASVIASNLFSNNILSAITTGNYWDVVNNYKPLMHTWYLGIVAEFYLIYPLIFLIPAKILKKHDKNTVFRSIFILISVLAIVSFALYLSPEFAHDSKFYYLPFRFYELALGGLIAFARNKIKKTAFSNSVFTISTLLLLALMLVNYSFINDTARLILTVLFASCALSSPICTDDNKWISKATSVFVSLGKKSYSYFIWHQVILAFWRCYVSSNFNFYSTAICLLITVLFAELSYYFIERKIKPNKKVFICCIICAVLLCSLAGVVYLRAGVIRDIPELGIYTDNVQRGMHAEYCDRIYDYDKDFEDDGRLKVLVVGNSFARDWANILMESSYADHLDISYAFSFSEKYASRAEQSDYIFIFGGSKTYNEFSKITDENKLWGIGTKNYGESNDMIYFTRLFDKDYFNTRVKPAEHIIEEHINLQKVFGDHYIDMISPIMNEDGEVRVFTNDNKFISQDCRHLTQAGAKFYAEILDLDRIFSKK